MITRWMDTLQEIEMDDMKEFIRGMDKRNGWVRKPCKRHIKYQHQSGQVLTISRTPSCHRALDNIMADVRRIERQYV